MLFLYHIFDIGVFNNCKIIIDKYFNVQCHKWYFNLSKP